MKWAALGWVALGGGLGSVIRALAGQLIPAGRLPWATVLVNVAGSCLIGILMARFALLDSGASGRAHSFWVVGVCGGFTTFSTFSWQTIEQMQKGNWTGGILNVVISLAGCLGATWLGWRLAR